MESYLSHKKRKSININFYFIKLLIVLYKIQLSILSPCGKEKPIKINGGECVESGCSFSLLESGNCTIENEIIKTQWLDRIIQYSNISIKYISLTVSQNGNLVCIGSTNSVPCTNFFFGLKKNGRPYFFEDDNESVFTTKTTEQQRTYGNIFSINLNLASNDDKEYIISLDNNNFELYDFYNNEVYIEDGISLLGVKFFSFTKAVIFRLNTEGNYYIISFPGGNPNNSMKCYFVFKLHFYNQNITAYPPENSKKFKASSFIDISSCFESENSYIFCFLANTYYYIYIYSYQLTQLTYDSLDSSLTFSDYLFYKCVHFTGDVGAFLYINNGNFEIQFKEYISKTIKDHFDSNSILVINKKNNYPKFTNFCDMIKLYDKKFLFVFVTIDYEELNLFIINNYVDEKLKIRHYVIKNYNLYHLKIQELSSSIYNGFISLAFGGSYYSISSFASLVIFSYPNSTDFTIDITTDLISSTNPIIKLYEKCKIENNIFGYIFGGFKIYNFTNGLKLLNLQNQEVIGRNSCLSNNTDIELNVTFENNEGSERIEYGMFAVEPEYGIFNQYATDIDNNYCGCDECNDEKEYFSPETYFGRISYLDIIYNLNEDNKDGENSTSIDTILTTVPVSETQEEIISTNEIKTDKIIPSKTTTNEIESTFPKIESIVPKIESTVPKIVSTVPKIESTVPKIVSTIPKIKSTIPKIESTIPKIKSTIPKIVSTVPKIVSTIPKIVSTIPQIESTIPKIESTIPKIASTIPKIESTIPKIESTVPKIVSIIPKIVSTVPKIESTVPKIESTVPKIESTIPKIESTIPKIISTIPKIEPTILYNVSTIPRVESSFPYNISSVPYIDSSILYNVSIIPNIESTIPFIEPTNPNNEPTNSYIESTKPNIESSSPNIESTNLNIESTNPIIFTTILKNLDSNINNYFECTNEEILDNQCTEGRMFFEQFDDIKNALLKQNKTNENTIIRTKNAIIQMSFVETQKYSDESGISSIDLGECGNRLKDANGIPRTEDLKIIKTDIKTDDLSFTYVVYEIYHPYTLVKLNLSICNEDQVSMSVPVKLDSNIESLINSLSEEGHDLFNENDSFYNDICTTYTSQNGTDMLLSDRKKDIFDLGLNQTMCQDGCEYKIFNLTNKKTKCVCSAREEKLYSLSIDNLFIKRSISNSFYASLKYSNFHVLKCYKLIIIFARIIKNIGEILMSVLFILFIILMIIYLFNGQKQISSFIDIIIKNKNLNNREYNNITKEKKKKRKMLLKNKNIFNRNSSAINKTENEKNKLNINKPKNEFSGKMKLRKKSKQNKNKEEPPKKKEKKTYKEINHTNNNTSNILLYDKNKKGVSPFSINNNFTINVHLMSPKKNRQIYSKKKSKRISGENLKIKNIFDNKKSSPLGKEIKSKDSFSAKRGFNPNTIQDLNYKDLNDYEINNLRYELALIYDKRSYFQYYVSLLKKKQLILFTFLPMNDYNLRYVKIALFIVSFSLYFTINGFFFNDKTMHKIYKASGSFNIIYQTSQILYSTMISAAINTILKYLSLSEKNILRLKEKNSFVNIVKSSKNLINCLRIKFFIFFLASFILMVFFWYFISCFCAVYTNTQIILLEDTLISFMISMIYPFGINLFPGIFRLYALRAKNKEKICIYKFSLILSYL